MHERQNHVGWCPRSSGTGDTAPVASLFGIIRAMYVMFDTIVDWLGLIFCPIGIIYGIVLVAWSYKWLLPFWQGRKVPDYGSLIQLVFFCFAFFSIGIGGFERFFYGKIDGVDVVATSLMKTAAIVVLLMTSTLLTVFEVRRWIGRSSSRE